jgi:hypothetical protein
MAQARKPPSYNSKRKRPSISKSTIDRDSPKPTRKNSSGNGRTNRSTSDGKLYCICRQPYDATRFMIACDRCDDWFHGECIHINEKESEFVDLYFCSKCAKCKVTDLVGSHSILLKKKKKKITNSNW